VGIDPGSVTLGAAALDVDLATGQVTLLEARTFDASKLVRDYTNLVAVHGERVARLTAHEDNLHGYFRFIEPHSIVSESPYMGRFPQAFAALTECITAIRRAVIRYDPHMPLLMVDPMNVKAAVDVFSKGRPKVGKGKHGKTGLTKDDVKDGLLRKLDPSITPNPIFNPNGIDIDRLDEHSIDAVAVAYSRARFILNHL